MGARISRLRLVTSLTGQRATVTSTVLACALLAGAVPAAAHLPCTSPHRGIYFVDANAPSNSAQRDTVTDCRSTTGRPYRFDVYGTFNYNGRLGFADCDYATGADGSYLAATWLGPNLIFRVNGVDAPCGPYSRDHHYSFVTVGDGRQFRLSIRDSYLPDNRGGLVVVIDPPL